MPHRDDIQGLRAVAVLLVALGHAGVPFLRGGYVGVDVFFVLSGFLITGMLLAEFAKRGYVSLSEFYVRRARRILPAATLTLVATLVAAHQLLNFVRAREAVTDTIWASLFGANVHFAREGSDYFEQGQPPSPVLHFWTLSVEEQFYLVWPSVVAVALAGTLFGRRRLLVIVLAGAILSLAWSIYHTAEAPQAAYFSTFARAWELGLGAALAIAAPTVVRIVSRWADRPRLARRSGNPFRSGAVFGQHGVSGRRRPRTGARRRTGDRRRAFGTPARGSPLPVSRPFAVRRRQVVRVLPLALAGADHRRPVRRPSSSRSR